MTAARLMNKIVVRCVKSVMQNRLGLFLLLVIPAVGNSPAAARAMPSFMTFHSLTIRSSARSCSRKRPGLIHAILQRQLRDLYGVSRADIARPRGSFKHAVVWQSQSRFLDRRDR